MWLLAINNFYIHLYTYVRTYICTSVCTVYSIMCMFVPMFVFLYKLSARLYISLEICIHLYVQQVLTNGDESKEPKKSKQEVCLCVCEGGGAQHLIHCVVDSMCPCMAASVESGQFPIDCLCVPLTHTYTYVRTRNGKISRFKTGWLLGL